MSNNRKRSCSSVNPKNKKVKIVDDAPAPVAAVITPARTEEDPFEVNIRAILRENPGWTGEVERLSDKDLLLMGQRDLLSTVEGVSFEPLLQPRKKDLTPVELLELQAMRARRTVVIDHVYKLLDGRFSRGFTCTDPLWIDTVKRMVVVAVVGAEGMRGPFEFKHWFMGAGLGEKMLDMNLVRTLGVPVTDIKLMIAIGLFAFIAACQRVHTSVRAANAVPTVRHGDLQGALRVVFGTFWGPVEKKRDTDVLVLASMMLAATFTEEAICLVPSLLTEIGISPKEFPVMLLSGHFCAVMFRPFVKPPTVVDVVVAEEKKSATL
jgi:hypothetical protein